jgi:aminopeptidase
MTKPAIRPQDFTGSMRRQFELAGRLGAAPGPWQAEAKALSARLAGNYADDAALMEDLLLAQRLAFIETAGLGRNDTFKRELDAAKIPAFKDFGSPPAPAELEPVLTSQLYGADPKRGAPVYFTAGRLGGAVLTGLVRRCVEEGTAFHVEFDDKVFNSLLWRRMSTLGAMRLGRLRLGMFNRCRRGITIVSPPEPGLPPPPALASFVDAPRGLFHDRWRKGEIHLSLTFLPHPAAAQGEGMSYADYTTLFYEACSQPWDRIGAAQLHLIDELDAAKTLRFTNEDGTDLSMSVDGFTFLHEVVGANVPGSETFSAPRRDSVEGVVVAKGRYCPPHRQGIVEDIRLKFEKGRIVEHYARRGQDILDAMVTADGGARYIGEIGIGTNPGIGRQVADILLTEKIAGSFHIALGNAYTFKEWNGKKVHLDNGNRSRIHWDITTMLKGRKGTISLDGREIMRDGRFIDPKYAVLNDGWAAVPDAERPPYWRRKLAAARNPVRPPPKP